MRTEREKIGVRVFWWTVFGAAYTLVLALTVGGGL